MGPVLGTSPGGGSSLKSSLPFGRWGQAHPALPAGPVAPHYSCFNPALLPVPPTVSQLPGPHAVRLRHRDGPVWAPRLYGLDWFRGLWGGEGEMGPRAKFKPWPGTPPRGRPRWTLHNCGQRPWPRQEDGPGGVQVGRLGARARGQRGTGTGASLLAGRERLEGGVFCGTHNCHHRRICACWASSCPLRDSGGFEQPYLSCRCPGLRPGAGDKLPTACRMGLLWAAVAVPKRVGRGLWAR